ncbi:MAG: dihydroorotate dehydrogenase electron transfer subunit, partial [Thermoplasmata archaeon]|nr:dihydroorotate dehydrogenase electron transfer subunit [Thermoplasmata archaeon]
WIPGVDEIPMSLSYNGGITAMDVGIATHALHGLKKGDKIGIKGPLGNGFELSGSNILAVGGGSGTAALAMAVEKALGEGKKVRCAIGAKTASELLFADRLKKAGAEVHIATDDGSVGHKGFVTQVAEKLIDENKPELIISCGPEPMLKGVVEIASKYRIECQVSLERYMKCGIGLCGSCQCGKFTVCNDGPVFLASELAMQEDFGKWKRDASGKKVKL